MGNSRSRSKSKETGRTGKEDASSTRQTASPLEPVQTQLETANDPRSTIRPATVAHEETVPQQPGGDSRRSADNNRQAGEPLTADTTEAAGVSDEQNVKACYDGTNPEQIKVTKETASSTKTVKPGAMRGGTNFIYPTDNDGETSHLVLQNSSSTVTESTTQTASSVKRTNPGAMGERGTIKKDTSTAMIGVNSPSDTTADGGKTQNESSTVTQRSGIRPLQTA